MKIRSFLPLDHSKISVFWIVLKLHYLLSSDVTMGVGR